MYYAASRARLGATAGAQNDVKQGNLEVSVQHSNVFRFPLLNVSALSEAFFFSNHQSPFQGINLLLKPQEVMRSSYNSTTKVTMSRAPLKVAIIGGGMSGICAACKIIQAFPNSTRPPSNDDTVADSRYSAIHLTLFELNEELGGTWSLQRYPGVACDSPSQLYSFWFQPNPSGLGLPIEIGG